MQQYPPRLGSRDIARLHDGMIELHEVEAALREATRLPPATRARLADRRSELRRLLDELAAR